MASESADAAMIAAAILTHIELTLTEVKGVNDVQAKNKVATVYAAQLKKVRV